MKKSFSIGIWLGISLFAVLAVFVFISQLQSHLDLSKQREAKNEEFQNAQAASRKIEDLERKSQELKQKENKMNKQVPMGDVQPLDLIKTITSSANKLGLHKISFKLKTASADAKKDKSPLPRSSGAAPKVVSFQMKFNASFTQALKFLKELNSMERIVILEKIEINRNPEILPYQAVVLDLITYSFVQ